MPTILKPGILVSLKTTLEGGVTYVRQDLEAEHTNGGGESVARWETTRKIDDPAEHARATKTRSEARQLIAKVCTTTAFGLLCPLAKQAELDEAVAQARNLCDLHNTSAQSTAVRIYVLRGQIAASDEEAARAIASEVEVLLASMANGIQVGDVARIREAANQVKQISNVLDESGAAKVQVGIEAARRAARELTKAAKDGEAPANLAPQLAAVEMSRFAFLDVDAPAGAGVVAAPAARNLEV